MEWIRLPMQLFKDERLLPIDAVVAAVIIDAEGAALTQSGIASDLGVSRKAVNESVQRLIAAGYVTVQQHGHGACYQCELLPPKKRSRSERAAQQLTKKGLSFDINELDAMMNRF